MGRRRELDQEFFNLVENPRGDSPAQAGPARPVREAEPAPAQPVRATCEGCGSSDDVMLVTYLRRDVEVTAHLCVMCKARRLSRVRRDEQPKKGPWPGKISLPRTRWGKS